MSESVKQRVEGLVSYILQGKILEAMTEFYADDLAMQENNKPATVGLAANIEREKQFLSQVKEWKSTQIKALGVDDAKGMTLVQYAFDFVNTQGQAVHYDQVAVQTWKNGKITHEKFYYDTAA